MHLEINATVIFVIIVIIIIVVIVVRCSTPCSNKKSDSGSHRSSHERRMANAQRTQPRFKVQNSRKKFLAKLGKPALESLLRDVSPLHGDQNLDMLADIPSQHAVIAQGTQTNKYHYNMGIQYDRPNNQMAVVRKEGKLLLFTTLHSVAYNKPVRNAVLEMLYENFTPEVHVPLENMNLISEYVEEFTQTDLSDCWGFVNKYYAGDHDGSNLKTDRYGLITSSRGLNIIKFDETELDSKKTYRYLQYIPMGTENAWGDAKTYDVHKLTLSSSDCKGLETLKHGQIIQIHDDTYHVDYPVKILTVSDLYMNQNSYEIDIKVKSDFALHPGMPYKDGDAEITMSQRILTAYFCKESGGSLYTIDCLPLLQGNDAIVTKDFSTLQGDWVLDQNSTSIISYGAYEKGMHNVYVNETQGKLYTLGLNDSNIYGFCHMLELEDNPNDPVPIAYYDVNYQHDFVVEYYTETEQMELLGIPNPTGPKFIGIGSEETRYSVVDVTDPANIQFISSTSIPDGGYYHQTWFTTDKKYLLIGDEAFANQRDQQCRIPVLRLYWNPNSENENKLELKFVQDIFGPFTTAMHNMYTVSNSKSENKFNDWIIGACYNAGTVIFSIKYDCVKRPKTPQGIFEYETRENPFRYKLMGFMDTSPYLTGGDGTWSVYPFWEIGKLASEIKYVSSDLGNGGATYFSYFKGVKNTSVQDPNQEGHIKLLSQPTMPKKSGVVGRHSHASKLVDEIDSNKPGFYATVGPFPNGRVALVRENGELADAIPVPIGSSQSLDVIVYQLLVADPDTVVALEVETELTERGEELYCISNGEFVSGKVIRPISSEYTFQSSGQRLDNYNEAIIYGTNTNAEHMYSLRVGEVICDLPVVPGDSGTPVVNHCGKLVGLVRDVDAAGKCGLINFSRLLNVVDGVDIPPAETTYRGFVGYFNDLADPSGDVQLDLPLDPRDLMLPLYNPRTGRMFFYLSGTGTRYFYMDPIATTYTEDESGIYEELVAESYATNVVTMNNETYFTRSFTSGGIGNSNVLTYRVIGNPGEDLDSIQIGEEFHGQFTNDGPQVAYIRQDPRYPQNEVDASDQSRQIRYIQFIAIGKSSRTSNDLYTDDQNINPFGGKTIHLAKEGDIITGQESGYTLEVLERDDQIAQGNELVPGVYDTFTFPNIGAKRGIFSYPFVSNPPALFPYTVRTADGLEYLDDYTFDPPLEILGSGKIKFGKLPGSSIRSNIIQISNTREFGRILQLTDSHAPPLNYNLGYFWDRVIAIDGEPVNADNTEYILNTTKYEERDVEVGYAAGYSVQVPLGKSFRPNFGYI